MAHDRAAAAFYSQGVLEGAVVIHGHRKEEGERKSDSPRNLFACTAKNSGSKGRLTEREERD